MMSECIPSRPRFSARLELATLVFFAVWATPPAVAASTSRLVPIVLDVFSGTAHFTTELSLTNAEPNPVSLTLRYTASLGAGSGTVIETLAKGQRVIPDVLSYLRGKGLQIPAGSSGQQGGTLLVTFDGVSERELISATARTTTATGAPQPVGSAGLAYRGLNPNEQTSPGIPLIYGLRANATDRSNVAVYNSSTTATVDVKMTAFSGTGDGQSKVIREALTLPPLGWAQVSFGGESGYSNGWMEVVGPCLGPDGCPVRAYGVINDNVTNDGSYINPVSGDFTGGGFVNIPVLVEAGAFRSELLLSNSASHSQVFHLNYHESLNSAGSSGVVTVTLGPAEQRIIPDAIQFLRDNGVSLAPAGSGSFVGSLYVEVPDSDIREIYAGARTASQSPVPQGGQYGLFSPEMVINQAAFGDEGYIFGLRADENNRSNVAVFNFTDDARTLDGPSELSLQVYDGDAGGAPAGSPEIVTVNPFEWKQVNNILAIKGVRNGWVKISHPPDVFGHSWAAYGVINDGGGPGQRTGDGAYIEMEKRTPPSSAVSRNSSSARPRASS